MSTYDKQAQRLLEDNARIVRGAIEAMSILVCQENGKPIDWGDVHAHANVAMHHLGLIRELTRARYAQQMMEVFGN